MRILHLVLHQKSVTTCIKMRLWFGLPVEKSLGIEKGSCECDTLWFNKVCIVANMKTLNMTIIKVNVKQLHG